MNRLSTGTRRICDLAAQVDDAQHHAVHAELAPVRPVAGHDAWGGEPEVGDQGPSDRRFRRGPRWVREQEPGGDEPLALVFAPCGNAVVVAQGISPS